jgi:hypothetical protein
VQGRFVGNKNCGTKPTRFVLNVAVHISGSRWVDGVGKRVSEQEVGQLMRKVPALTAGIVAVIVNDDMPAGRPGLWRRSSAGLGLDINDINIPDSKEVAAF